MTDLWFTRATLKRGSPDVAPLIATLLDGEDAGRLANTTHRLLWTLMPEERQRTGRFDTGGPDKAAFLWRSAPDANDDPVWYLLGPEPRRDSAFFHVATKPWAPVFAAGDRLSFDLIVNATVDRMVDPGAGRDGRRRVDVVMDAMIARERGGDAAPARPLLRRQAAEEALSAWWRRQGERTGFAPLSIDVADYRALPLERGRSTARHRPQIGVGRLTGTVEVADPEAFTAKLAAGFGRAKAFGCGLMLVKRAG